MNMGGKGDVVLVITDTIYKELAGLARKVLAKWKKFVHMVDMELDPDGRLG
jgi:hypothetical protein